MVDIIYKQVSTNFTNTILLGKLQRFGMLKTPAVIKCLTITNLLFNLITRSHGSVMLIY